MTAFKREYSLIGRGKNGWHADGIHNEAGDTFSSSGGTLEHYLSEAPEGCPIYDADEADHGAFVKIVIGGPMVKVNLEPGTIKRFEDIPSATKTLLGMLPGLQDGFKTLATMALADLSSLDYVSTDVYLQLLREKVPGIKIGKVVGGKIVWEDAC